MLLAVMMVYKYWDSITKEDLEFSVGSKTTVWEVKDPLLANMSYSNLNPVADDDHLPQGSYSAVASGSNYASPNLNSHQSASSPLAPNYQYAASGAQYVPGMGYAAGSGHANNGYYPPTMQPHPDRP